jgi:hypothetical protein
MSRLVLIIFTLLFLTANACFGQGVFLDWYRRGGSTGNNLLTGLQAYYKFDEASGNATDSSGNGRDLTQYGTLESIAGRIGTSRNHESDENDDYFGIANAAWNTFGTNDFTVSYWFNVMDAISGSPDDQYHICKADSATESSWLIGVDRGFAYANEYALVFYAGTNGAFFGMQQLLTIELPQTLVANDVWWFVALTRSGTNFTMYLARETDPTITLTSTNTLSGELYNSSTVPLTVGSYLSGGTPEPSQDTEGAIDELGIWNVALSSCQVLKLFNSGSGRAHSTFDSNPCL